MSSAPRSASSRLHSLLAEQTPTFDMSTNLPEGEWPWGSPSFKSLGPHKIEARGAAIGLGAEQPSRSANAPPLCAQLIYKCIMWGLDMIITDVDALVLREVDPERLLD